VIHSMWLRSNAELTSECLIEVYVFAHATAGDVGIRDV
jgi:hypothetical protein